MFVFMCRFLFLLCFDFYFCGVSRRRFLPIKRNRRRLLRARPALFESSLMPPHNFMSPIVGTEMACVLPQARAIQKRNLGQPPMRDITSLENPRRTTRPAETGIVSVPHPP